MLIKRIGKFALLLVLLLSLAFLPACDDEETGTPGNGTNGDENGEGSGEKVTITIGNLTDQTGVAAQTLAMIDAALKDIVEYYNDNELIPGVRFRIVEYDTQYDSAKAIPGYQKLKSDGADFIWTPVTLAVPVLKPRLDRDKFVAFTATANMKKEELNGGYVFSLGITPENEAYTLMEWIAENDEDFPADRPAKIGGAAWDDGYSNLVFSAAKDYADAHPELYDWDKSFLTEFGFNWTVQAEELKDCDYVFIPIPPHIFIRDYVAAGGNAKFLGTDPALAFTREIGKTGLWDEVDGSLFLRSSRWYNETGEIIDLTNQLLDEKHSESEAKAYRQQGCTYISIKNLYIMLDIVKETVERYGAENFNSETLYETATSWQFEYDGIPDFNNFTETKRIAQNYYAVYEASAAVENIVRAHEDWIPEVESP
ncbi:MAG: ABC transporter substrate-binding protein [Dehalococcoidia bacterium]